MHDGKEKEEELRACQIVARNYANTLESMRICYFLLFCEVMAELMDQSASVLTTEDSYSSNDEEALEISFSNLSIDGEYQFT